MSFTVNWPESRCVQTNDRHQLLFRWWAFFGTVQRINQVIVMSTIYFNRVVPVQSVAKLWWKGKKWNYDAKGYTRLTNFSSLFLVSCFSCYSMPFCETLKIKLFCMFFAVSHGYSPAGSKLLFASVTVVCPVCDFTQLLWPLLFRWQWNLLTSS